MLESEMAMEISSDRFARIKDMFGIALFVVAVFVGAWLINLFIFRSFNVDGPSMQNTLHTGDRLIVNRLPVTWEHIRGRQYVPERGNVIVFENPRWQAGERDQYIVKRVIAFPGEQVVVKDGEIRVYSSTYPNGLDVDALHPGALLPTDGSVDMVVPKNEIFVAGDHRQEGYSYDSRNGLGTIPYENIIGPVALRIYPFTQIRTF